jgi:metal-responsive CopG/Arc/MetJ family transcriptional regulator
MKTAISLPDDLFENADALARRTGRSRSELYVAALREYLERHDEDRITAALNAVCAEEDSALEPDLKQAARRTLARDAW